MDLSDDGEPMVCEERNDVKIPDDAFDDFDLSNVKQEQEQEQDNDEVYPLQRSTFFLGDEEEQQQAGPFEVTMSFFTQCPCLDQPEQDINFLSGVFYVECEDLRYGPTTRVFIDQPETAKLDASRHSGYKSHVSCYDCFMKGNDQRLSKYHISEVFEQQTSFVHGLPAIAFHYSNVVKRNHARFVAFRNMLKVLQPPSSVPVEIGWTIASAACLLRVMDTQGLVDGVDHHEYAENARKWTQATLASNVLNQLSSSSSCRAFHAYVRQTVLPELVHDHPLTHALRTALDTTPPPPGIFISTTPCPSTAAMPSTPATSVASALGRMDIQSPLPSSASSSSISVRRRCLGSGSSVDSLYEVPGAPMILAPPTKKRKGRKPNPEKKPKNKNNKKKQKQCVLLQDAAGADLKLMTKDEQTKFLRPIKSCLRILRSGEPHEHQAKTIALMHRVHEVNPGYVDSLKHEQDRVNYRSFLLSHPIH